MSKAEGFLIINSQNAVAANGDKAREAARPYPPNVARRTLADISNLLQKDKPLTQDHKSHSIPTTVKEYIEQLQKENMALAKMLAQRNKIVEQSGIELERLRLNFIKMREQNQHLALSHTQMLAELNSGKDRLKALQHELGCKNGLLQARSSKLEVNSIEEDESSKEGRDHEKPCKAKRRLRSLSVGSSEQLQPEDNAGNRQPVRRQSARFKAIKPNGDSLSEVDDAKFANCVLPDGTTPSTSEDASVINEDHVANRPSVRRQSARFNAVTPKQADDLSEIDGTTVPRCPFPDKTVQEKALTSVDTSVRNEDHAGNRPSVRRQSARFTAVRAKQADDLFEMEEAKFPKCLLPVPDNDSTVENEDHVVQRSSARRQSARFNAKRPKQSNDLLEMDGNISPKHSSPEEQVLENGSTSVDTTVKNEDDSSCSGGRCESQEVRKPSLGRPSRVAARKVSSYKEIPVNTKMRRP